MTESVPVRFARLATGARIAYASAGQGSPLVMVPGWLCHLQESWSHPSAASARDKLAAAHTFLWYDRLGCGLSDRDGFDMSLDNDVEQLVAVLDAAGVERADLIGYSFGAPPAAAFAARYPERVNRLIFYSAFARLQGHTTAERMEGLKQVVRMDWSLGSLTLACRLLPNASSGDLRWFSRFQQLAATAEMAAGLLDHMWRLDVRDVLPDIRAPALVLHNRHDPAIPLRAGREIAALVPGAGMHILAGNEHDPFIRDSGAVVEAILDFSAGRPLTSRATAPVPSAELTAREQEVLRLVAQGQANKEIAAGLGISVATVERHVTNTYRKLGARGRADAVMSAVAMGLASPSVPADVRVIR
jgi:pimeloyl-ACP methyl ester carboxylesterase/DNA-binding CsgD family transcriptional regulator